MSWPAEVLQELDITNLIAISGLIWFFYNRMERRFEKFEQKVENRFERIELDIKEIRKDVSNLDKEVAVITATLAFNGYDLTRHKVEGE